MVNDTSHSLITLPTAIWLTLINFLGPRALTNLTWVCRFFNKEKIAAWMNAALTLTFPEYQQVFLHRCLHNALSIHGKEITFFRSLFRHHFELYQLCQLHIDQLNSEDSFENSILNEKLLEQINTDILREYCQSEAGDQAQLNLSFPYFTRIPESLFTQQSDYLNNLTHIYCDNTGLVQLPAFMAGLPKLQELSCRHNYLSSLPPTLLIKFGQQWHDKTLRSQRPEPISCKNFNRQVPDKPARPKSHPLNSSRE